ncbi:angiopoietin-related protein 1-like [Ctenocephalides felis]|nr:angiopoietin-related protein 1-like [Ctenocephalides felis]
MTRDSQNYITKQYFNSAMQNLKQSLRHYDMAMKATYRDSGNNRPSIDGNTDNIPVDCWEAYKSGAANISGPYRIRPVGADRPLFAYCDQERWGGGWTVLQTRFDGSTDFYRPYQDYVHGFGNVAGEHWLGLETAHLLTSNGLYELLIDLQDFDEIWTYAYYKSFSIGPEAQSYPINVLGAYYGDAGDSLAYQAGHKFSAHDLDNDNWPEGSCAQAHHGAWWYHACEQSNLNGLYLSGQIPEDVSNQGMYWYEFHGPGYSLKASRMMIRPAGARTDFKNKTAMNPKTKSDARQAPNASSDLSDYE